MSLVVRQGGMHTTVQDRGRFGAQALGVPVSGALEPEMLWLANTLVGNAPDEAALEIMHIGPVLEVATTSARLALATYGGAWTLETDGGARAIVPWRSVTVRQGERVRITTAGGAACAYLAVEGGFALAPVMGSLSTYVRGRIGGLGGRILAAGDRLPLKRAQASDRPDVHLPAPPQPEQGPLRVVPGPQVECFQDGALDLLCRSTYTVGRAADRMGLRLEGPELPHRDGHDIVSDGIATGAIQVPGDRRPVLLLADRQTTGGYPKIGTVCTADLPRAGRLKPGDEVRFAVVTVTEAQALARRRHAELAALVATMAPAETSVLDVEALYRVNLVSGAIADGDHD